VVILVFTPAPVLAADGANAGPSPDVPRFDATDVTAQIQAEAAAILFASARQMTEADGPPPGPALAVAAQDTPAHPRAGGLPPPRAARGSMRGVVLRSAPAQGGTPPPPVAPPEPAPRPLATAGELPPPGAKPADRHIPSFAGEAADLLTHALSGSLATV